MFKKKNKNDIARFLTLTACRSIGNDECPVHHLLTVASLAQHRHSAVYGPSARWVMQTKALPWTCSDRSLILSTYTHTHTHTVGGRLFYRWHHTCVWVGSVARASAVLLCIPSVECRLRSAIRPVRTSFLLFIYLFFFFTIRDETLFYRVGNKW